MLTENTTPIINENITSESRFYFRSKKMDTNEVWLNDNAQANDRIYA